MQSKNLKLASIFLHTLLRRKPNLNFDPPRNLNLHFHLSSILFEIHIVR